MPKQIQQDPKYMNAKLLVFFVPFLFGYPLYYILKKIVFPKVLHCCVFLFSINTNLEAVHWQFSNPTDRSVGNALAETLRSQ